MEPAKSDNTEPVKCNMEPTKSNDTESGKSDNTKPAKCNDTGSVKVTIWSW